MFKTQHPGEKRIHFFSPRRRDVKLNVLLAAPSSISSSWLPCGWMASFFLDFCWNSFQYSKISFFGFHHLMGSLSFLDAFWSIGVF
ncbi:hypothetical protein B9Z55_029044 [Caenorhabditis nigoni]|uniref:Uncharacterized protein n=1 Tax=Caenorhabditis nigoni TaxID=1611254 RepID=A0A2G5S995_9PELO|nr:hypothetical protein B9Z55_029044 [Caenorhabditis nigoni]